MVYIKRRVTAAVAAVGIAVMCCFLLTGCVTDYADTDSELYQRIEQQTQQFSQNTQEARNNSISYTKEKAYAFCLKMQDIAPTVIVGSIVLMIFFLLLITEDQAARKKIVVVFGSIIFVMVVLSIGLSYLVGAYL